MSLLNIFLIGFIVGVFIGFLSNMLTNAEKIRQLESQNEAYKELAKKHIKIIAEYEKAEKKRSNKS